MVLFRWIRSVRDIWIQGEIVPELRMTALLGNARKSYLGGIRETGTL